MDETHSGLSLLEIHLVDLLTKLTPMRFNLWWPCSVVVVSWILREVRSDARQAGNHSTSIDEYDLQKYEMPCEEWICLPSSRR